MRHELGLLLSIALIGLGCGTDTHEPPVATAAGSAEATPALALDRFEIVDLTHTLGPDTLFWPTESRGLTLERTAWGQTEGGYFYAAHYISMPEHGGTHLDAPLHFGEGRQATDAIPLERVIGPAVVLDISDQAAEDPDYLLTRDDVEAWETEHGSIPEGSLALLRTGWGDRWPDREKYFGNTGPEDVENLHFPSFGEEAAEYLIRERKVALLGVDTASIDYGQSQDFAVHRLAARANVPALENLASLSRLPATGALVFAPPVKIAGGSGAPVRVVALVPREALPTAADSP